LPSRGSPFEEVAGTLTAADTTELPFGDQTLVWHHYRAAVRLVKLKASVSSRDILQTILAELLRRPEQQLALLRQINGVIGAANSRYEAPTPEALFSILLQRFGGRPELAEFVSHAQFRAFLSRKAEEICQRRGRP
jgi:hypothetical protein